MRVLRHSLRTGSVISINVSYKMPLSQRFYEVSHATPKHCDQKIMSKNKYIIYMYIMAYSKLCIHKVTKAK